MRSHGIILFSIYFKIKKELRRGSRLNLSMKHWYRQLMDLVQGHIPDQEQCWDWNPGPLTSRLVLQQRDSFALETEESISCAKQFLKVPRPRSPVSIWVLISLFNDLHTSFDASIKHNYLMRCHKTMCVKEHVRTEHFAGRSSYVKEEIWESLNDTVQIMREVE